MKRLLLATAMIGITASAQADDTAGLFRKVGAWDVRVDDSLGHGCFILAGYPDGGVMRIGIDNRGKPSGYMMLANSAWKSLEVGKAYTVDLNFDSMPSQAWNGKAVAMHESKMLMFPFTNYKFLESIAERQQITISYQGHPLGKFNLPGTAAAIQAMIECQRAFGSSTGEGGDPFQSSSADPFVK